MLPAFHAKIKKLEATLGITSTPLLDITAPASGVETNSREADITLFVGDNVKHLNALATNAANSIDFCYIDPPYNTGSNFLYKDRRKSPPNGPFGSHNSWMSFMLPRLVAAREIINTSGTIAISIDDYEQPYLKILMDNIFGEDNFIANIVVCRSRNGKGSKNNISPCHEYLLVYGKSKSSNIRGQLDASSYDRKDEHGSFRLDGLFRKKGHGSLRTDRPNMFYPLYFNPKSGEVFLEPGKNLLEVYPKDSKGVERRWLWGSNTAKERRWKLHASPKGVIYVKNYAGNEAEKKRTKVKTIWSETEFFTERATKEIKDIFGDKIFDTPKPLKYIKKIIDISTTENAVILDFFAGSGTTAHAIAELNKEDGGSRKCILMETDCDIPTQHIAAQHGFKKVFEITAKRLEKIKNENPDIQYSIISEK